MRCKGTMSLFVQSIIFDVDDGDLRLDDLNFIKKLIAREMDGTAFTTIREFFTVENQKVFYFPRGIILLEDMEFTVTENGGVDTVFQVTVEIHRRSKFAFTSGKEVTRGGSLSGLVPPEPVF